MLHAVIMAGGSGRRFWPKSRRNKPKQLLRLYGDATMLQQTVARIKPLVPPANVARRHRGGPGRRRCSAQLPGRAGRERRRRALSRDTAPCVGLAADDHRQERSRGHDDRHAGRPRHQPRDAFSTPVEPRSRHRRRSHGIRSHSASSRLDPRPGYGYIERGELLGSTDGIAVYKVVQFREKPDRATAESSSRRQLRLELGDLLWRARGDPRRAARAPTRPRRGPRTDPPALGTPGEAAVHRSRVFPRWRRIPIDKAVMEKAANVRVLEVIYDWNDVGDWRRSARLIIPTRGQQRPGTVPSVETSELDHRLRRRRPDRHARRRRPRDRPVRQGDPGRPEGPARQAQRAGRRTRKPARRSAVTVRERCPGFSGSISALKCVARR